MCVYKHIYVHIHKCTQWKLGKTAEVILNFVGASECDWQRAPGSGGYHGETSDQVFWNVHNSPCRDRNTVGGLQESIARPGREGNCWCGYHIYLFAMYKWFLMPRSLFRIILWEAVWI